MPKNRKQTYSDRQSFAAQQKKQAAKKKPPPNRENPSQTAPHVEGEGTKRQE